MDFINEYAIMTLALEKDLRNVIYQRGVMIGEDHVALEMIKTYQTDFRVYLETSRSHRDLVKILL